MEVERSKMDPIRSVCEQARFGRTDDYVALETSRLVSARSSVTFLVGRVVEGMMSWFAHGEMGSGRGLHVEVFVCPPCTFFSS